jgi:hypothetical protein
MRVPGGTIRAGILRIGQCIIGKKQVRYYIVIPGLTGICQLKTNIGCKHLEDPYQCVAIEEGAELAINRQRYEKNKVPINYTGNTAICSIPSELFRQAGC